MGAQHCAWASPLACAHSGNGHPGIDPERAAVEQRGSQDRVALAHGIGGGELPRPRGGTGYRALRFMYQR